MKELYKDLTDDKFGVFLVWTLGVLLTLLLFIIGNVVYNEAKIIIATEEKIEVVGEVEIKGKDTTTTMIVNNTGNGGVATPVRTNYVVFEYEGEIYENTTGSKAYRRLFEGEIVKVNIIEYLDKEGNIIKLKVDFKNLLE